MSAKRKDTPLPRELVPLLLEWFRRKARKLPWRETRDPYRVWLSEIMLQQTRVDTVINYFNRFLTALPDLPSLAAAPEDQLLKLWEGLGYYSRVRNLGKAAQLIMKEHDGKFPAEAAQLEKLPGIGAYTAGAILSIAFGQPCPAVDGNVLRVLTRLTADPTELHDFVLKKKLTAALAAVYPPPGPLCGDFTESLMELGATVCLPNGAPRCGECPVATLCEAHRKGCETAFPVVAKKTVRRTEALTVLRLQCGDRIALRRRPDKGILAKLWELPNVSGHLTAEEVRSCLENEWHAEVEKTELLPPHHHLFTHLEWQMQGYAVTIRKEIDGPVWVTPEELRKKYSLPTAFWPFLECAVSR